MDVETNAITKIRAKIHDEPGFRQRIGFKEKVEASGIAVNMGAGASVPPLAMRAGVIPKGFCGLDVHDCTS